MKLRNKKTGDVYELNEFCLYDDKGFAKRPFLKTLAELNEEWEDYNEEPDGIEDVYEVGGSVFIQMSSTELCNKAIKKLKAWQRLKDKGFRFDGWKFTPNCDGAKLADKITIKACMRVNTSDFKDLDLLFSGGEE